MAEFGGIGGCSENIPFAAYEKDLFAQALERAYGERIRTNPKACVAVWSALANTHWVHMNGDVASYSFRAAGDLIASIRREGNYMDWYCSGPYAVIDSDIEDAMNAEGWAGHVEDVE